MGLKVAFWDTSEDKIHEWLKKNKEYKDKVLCDKNNEFSEEEIKKCDCLFYHHSERNGLREGGKWKSNLKGKILIAYGWNKTRIPTYEKSNWSESEAINLEYINWNDLKSHLGEVIDWLTSGKRSVEEIIYRTWNYSTLIRKFSSIYKTIILYIATDDCLNIEDLKNLKNQLEELSTIISEEDELGKFLSELKDDEFLDMEKLKKLTLLLRNKIEEGC